jgi:hypothetical protein
VLQNAVSALRALLGRSPIRSGDLAHRRVLMEDQKARAPVRLSATIERDPVF